jgi:AmmeMemoRadiSam system protein A
MLDESQRQTLLRIARETIAAGLAGRHANWSPDDVDETLRRPAGAFVTLTIGGELRGCIGSIQAVEPLYQAVATSARNAAFRDPRFLPVGDDAELGRIELEISVMGPIERVTDVGEIVVGRDGLIISRGRQAGLLLPQVATDYGWDRETFLAQTCNKAGLPKEAWRDPNTRIEKFSAEVFGEHPAAHS